MELAAAKMIGAGLAAIGVIGAGIGIGAIFASFIQAVGRNPAAAGAVSYKVWYRRWPVGIRHEPMRRCVSWRSGSNCRLGKLSKHSTHLRVVKRAGHRREEASAQK